MKSSIESQPGQTDMSLVHRIFDQAFNKGDLGILDELFLADSITHIKVWGFPSNRTGFKQLIASFRLAFPDLHWTIEDEISAGDKVAAHLTMSGTHRGLFFGNLPTGRPVVVQGMLYGHMENGRITEIWLMVDQMDMLQQLGIVPPSRGIL